MAGILTISPGHDASYPWRQIGTSEDPSAGTPADYYLTPAAKGGEPSGRWSGRACPSLGLAVGSVVDREVFEPLYGKFLDPRDPTGESRLGRAPQRFRSAEDMYQAMLRAEPEAIAERRAQLRIDAHAQARTPVLFFDATYSVSKTISLLHASALANAAEATTAGDLEAAGYWEAAAAEVWECIAAANQAALFHLQDEAGYTRSGYHGRRTDGAETGRWEDAHRWLIASFPQHTSRDGDPQLHIHNLILNRVCRERDGAWRTLDSRALFRARGAASAIATVVMENELTRRFDVSWVLRADGHGREVDGVSRQLAEMFSSRRQSIGPLTQKLAAEFRRQHGREPDARALGALRQLANGLTRRGKDHKPLDLTALVRQWAGRARAGESALLEPVMPATTNRAGPRAAPDGEAGTGAVPGAPARGAALTPGAEARLIAEALACCQAAHSTWSRSDLIRHLGERIPADLAVMSPEDAAALLPELAAKALAGAAEPVVALEAPEWPPAPQALRRADGQSVYSPHGASRYATEAQLTLEEQLVARARQHGAPGLTQSAAAAALGADQDWLEAQLADAAAPELGVTGSGLRLDQAAAVFWLLTSGERLQILVGPAGSGKTWTIATMARLWQQAGLGEVIGLTTAQAARNVLAEAGVSVAHNTADFLGHDLDGQREVRGTRHVARRTLIVVDEASMVSMADMAAIAAVAERRDCKVVIAGDHEQLAAVEGGGAMLMLARRLGYAQLAEPVRFTAEWEREATLRLRTGDASVLADYDEHGRICSAPAEQATEQAYRGWLADYLAGRDSLLMARTEEQAAELGRRARNDLVRYGLVSADDEVPLRNQAAASAGDLIMARLNDQRIYAGVSGRWLTNRDVLQVIDTRAGQDSALVRLQAGRGKDGSRQWGRPFLLPKDYLTRQCHLAYAATQHSAQGRTVETAHVLADGLCDRQGLYVALSRGQDGNYVYVIVTPRAADVRQGALPAAELGREQALARERAGLPPDRRRREEREAEEAADGIAVLAQILRRDGAELSATETLQRELSDADHLGVLGSAWHDLAQQACRARFERALRRLVPPDLAEDALADPAVTWLWRSLREAEAAGLDGPEVLAQAAAIRSLADARDIARVLDSRVRDLLTGVEPVPPGPWSARVPDLGDPELNRFMRQLAEAMDDRTVRLGEHASETLPLWARRALGPVPDDPAGRADWQQRAAAIAAHRELYGYAHPADAIGPAPAKTSPEARAAWRGALAALGLIDGIDLRDCTDGRLQVLRSAYQRETEWAPPHVGEALRLVRLARKAARTDAIRAEHEACRPGPADARPADLARIWRAVEAKAAREEQALEAAQATRREWEQMTEQTRRVAFAADTELRRRHPGEVIEPLRSAEPPEFTVPRPNTTGPRSGEPGPDTSRAHPPDSDPLATALQALGLTPAQAGTGLPPRFRQVRRAARRTQDILDQMRGLRIPAADDDELSPGQAWDIVARRDRDAIIQPATPQVPPSPIVSRLAAREAAQP